MQKIKQFIFGIRAKGEKLPEPKLPTPREMNTKDFYNWCKELNVSRQYDRKIIHLN